VTLRDANRDGSWLDFLRKSWDIDRITRPIDLHRRWNFIQEIRLEKDNLVWQQAEPDYLDNRRIFDGAIERQAILTRRQAERDGRAILDDFLKLRNGKDDAILNYARIWGVLELCRHNLPACHEFSIGAPLRLPGTLPPNLKIRACRSYDRDPRQCQPLGTEPLSTWRFFSHQAWALLNIAADLQRGRRGEDRLWASILREGFRPAQSLESQAKCLRDAVEVWLRLGRIKPTIDDLSGGLTWTGADLFGELAVQLALTVKGMEGQVFCIVCGKPYAPKRRVIRRGFNFCPAPACQREAAARRAKRYRDRKHSGSSGRARDLPYRGVYGGRTNDPLFSE
jgi:hypothetical protein